MSKQTIILAIVLGVLSTIGLLLYNNQFRKFDKADWDINTGSLAVPKYPHRAAMVDDLLHHYELEGYSKKELINLLGKSYKVDYQDDKKIIISYLIEMERQGSNKTFHKLECTLLQDTVVRVEKTVYKDHLL